MCAREDERKSWEHRRVGVDGVNENGQYHADIFPERGLFLTIILFQHKLN